MSVLIPSMGVLIPRGNCLLPGVYQKRDFNASGVITPLTKSELKNDAIGVPNQNQLLPYGSAVNVNPNQAPRIPRVPKKRKRVEL